MDNHLITERIGEIAGRVAKDSGIEFVHAEVKGASRNLTVRIFIDKPGGVTLDDCSTVSKGIEKILDADDFIPVAYLLEVSSPGLERELYTIGDFEKFIGHKAKVKMTAEIDGKKAFIGRIEGVEGGEIIFEDKTSGIVRFPYSSVAKANLRVDLEKEFKKR